MILKDVLLHAMIRSYTV